MAILVKMLKGDLFEAENIDRSIILHACNSKNVWGKGFAKILKGKYKNSYSIYSSLNNKPGMGYIAKDKGQRIACLVTSKGYGDLKDSEEDILKNTETAIHQLFQVIEDDYVIINSPKINSGLFKVPFDKTLKIIKKCCKETDLKGTWIIWEL